MKRSSAFWRRIIGGAAALVVMSSLVIAAPQPAAAQVAFPTLETFSVTNTLQTIKDAAQFAWEKAQSVYDKINRESAGLAFRKGVEFFTQKIARDTALWVASGARGQGPLFITQGWEAYMKDAADGAAGAILDELTKPTITECEREQIPVESNQTSESCDPTTQSCSTTTFTPGNCLKNPDGTIKTKVKTPGGILEGLGLCNPDINTSLQINLGLLPARLREPSCTFSRLKQNWEREIAKASFLPSLQQSFDPSQNDLGIALNLQTNLLEQQRQKQLEVFGARIEGGGFKATTDGAAGVIKTPATAVASILDQTLGTSLGGQLEDTGTILGNAINVFTNTLASSFLNNLITNGLGALGGGSGGPGGRGLPGGSALSNPDRQTPVEGVEAARTRLARDVQANFTTPGRYDILSQLVTCPQANNPGPNDCVMTDKMSSAISQKMTVAQAMEKGLINADGPFGFTGWDPAPIEPAYTDGVPYRSILILRKYRIVPVGWELAARYIQSFGKVQVSLRELTKTGGCEGGGVYDCATSPYYHLVDPNWVLSVPEAYCKVSGPGPQIVSTQVAQGVDNNKDGKFDGPNERPPTVQVRRNDYCADEQTCIERDANGTCKFFGYCTEEKKVWNFGEGACNPIFNTCTTLENKQTGQTVSYLLNTVNFDHCDNDSAGCRAYSRVPITYAANDPLYKSEPDHRAWSTKAADTVYLNAQAAACDGSDAGCHAFIQTGLGLPVGSGKGVSILTNGSFEHTSASAANPPVYSAPGWTLSTGSLAVGQADGHDGGSYANDITQAKQQISFGMPVVGQTMTLSFWARGAAGATLAISDQWFGADGTTSIRDPKTIPLDRPQNGSLLVANEWQQYHAVFTIVDVVPTKAKWQISIAGSTAAVIFDLDAIKLEAGANDAPAYTPYGMGTNGTGIIHLKRPAPGTCSVSEANTAACQPYARRCSPAEVGCMAYAPTIGGPTITSVQGDQCPAECVGYDTYVQSKTFFESAGRAELIPKTAKKCNAALVGCDEFTNVDEEASGGEAKEYYQRLRYCAKPVGGQTSAAYYTWEGSDTAGFQLKVFTLLPSNGGGPAITAAGTTVTTAGTAPCVNFTTAANGIATCTDAAATNWGTLERRDCVATDLGSDADCRQFYSQNGDVSLRKLSHTVSITNDCHPYRKTQSTECDCAGTGANCPAQSGSGGHWNGTACMYQTVPSEGKKCSAVAAGCREYRGGASANYRVISSDTFETGAGNWSGGRLSAVAKDVGGHSYQLPATANTMTKVVTLATTAQSGDAAQTTSVQLAFAARAQTSSGGVVTVAVAQRPVGATTTPVAITVANPAQNVSVEWEQKQMDPIVLSGRGIELTITLTAGNGAPIYVDNITLSSNINTHYLIKDSSQVPGACLPGTTGALLGCQNYRVSDGAARNIWRFGNSCSAEVVGCKALIDTQNSTVGAAAPFLATTKGQTVAADTMDFFVDAADKRCNGSAQGCTALGIRNDTDTHWEHVCSNNTQKACVSDDDCGASNTCVVQPRYLKDNPDDYSRTLCAANQTQCAAFTTDTGGTLYFKDPGGAACRYRSDVSQPGWYLPFDKVCQSDNTTFCQSNGDCGAGGRCAAPTGPNCNSDVGAAPRTLLTGGASNKGFAESAAGRVGACPAAQNSCREYIDPRSDDQRNLIYNGDFILQTSGTTPDGWSGAAFKEVRADGVRVAETTTVNDHDGLRQNVTLDGQTVYVLSADVKQNTNEPAPAFIGLRNCQANPPAPSVLNCRPRDSDGDGVITIIDAQAATKNAAASGGNCPGGSTFCVGDLDGNGTVAITEVVTLGNEIGTRCEAWSPDKTMLSMSFGTNNTEVGAGTYITPTNPNGYQRVTGQFYLAHAGTYKCDVVIGTGGIAKDRVAVGVPNLTPDGTNGHWFNHVSLRRANVAYQLASRVDRRSCAGLVNTDAGCVLFNEREVSNERSAANGGNLAYTGMRFNANIAETGKAPNTAVNMNNEFGTCGAAKTCSNLTTRSCVNDADCNLPFNANTLLKVAPERACAAWLSCRTARTVTVDGVTKNICLDVQTCEQLDNNGNCTRQSLADSAATDLVYNAGSVDQIRNRSGYSKVGFNWKACSQKSSDDEWKMCTTTADCTALGLGTCNQILPVSGALSPAYMPQIGQAIDVYNGNFEIASASGNPSGWAGWKGGENMRAIADPLTAQKVGVAYPREGRSFLEVNANHPVPVTHTNTSQADAFQPTANMSSFIAVTGNTEYTISAYINTLHFTGERAEVRVLQYSDAKSGSPIAVSGNKYRHVLDTPPGLDWQLRTSQFETEAATRYIRLMFAWYGDGTPGQTDYKGLGFWYIDDLKIQPALQLQKTTPTYTGSSCQLYPQQDALSCKYFDGNGLRQRGKQGYCLEWDPKNSNYCLQWWPVDSIIGEDSEQDRAGYNDKAPLYYCLAAEDGFMEASRYACLFSRGHSSPFRGAAPGIKFTVDPVETGTGQCGGYGASPCNGGTASAAHIYDLESIESPGSPKIGGEAGLYGGMVDIPGTCVANLTSSTPVSDYAGCEVLVETASDIGSGDNNFYEVSVSKDRANWYVLGSPTSGRVHLFDLASIKNVSGLQNAAGPWRYLRLQDTSDCDNGHTAGFLPTKTWVRQAPACSYVAQLVTPDGAVKGYSSRLISGSTFPVPGLNYTIQTDAKPFGSATPPAPIDNPEQWDTNTQSARQPLFVLDPSTATSDNIARAGSPYNCVRPAVTAGGITVTVECFAASVKNYPFVAGVTGVVGSGTAAIQSAASQALTALKSLFVESHGTWSWQQVCLAGANEGRSCAAATAAADCPGATCGYRYNPDATIGGLQEPDKACVNASDRSAGPVGGPAGASCGIAPKIWPAAVAPRLFSRIGTTALKFTFTADPDQLPVTRYIVDWGDGTKSVQAGLHLQSHPSPDNGITLLHTYTYADIARCWAETAGADPCRDRMLKMGSAQSGTSFVLQPRVQVTDNWNWCNGVFGSSGYYGSSCSRNDCRATAGGCAWQASADKITISQQ